MLIDLRHNIKNLDDTDLLVNGSVVTMDKELANNLSLLPQSEDSLKVYNWAKKLYSEGCLELNNEEIIKLKQLIEASRLFVFAKGQILDVINQCVLLDSAK